MKRFARKAQSQPKHGPPSVSSASKATVLPRFRPDFNGSGHGRKTVRRPAPQAQPATPAPTVQEQILPVQLQQLILDIIRSTFPASNEFEALKPALRKVKDALDIYDYDAAFANEESLEAYTIRWSPSRALAYANVLAWVFQEIQDHGLVEGFTTADSQKPAKAVCFGRGAADFLAFAALIKHLQAGKTDDVSDHSSASDTAAIPTNKPTRWNVAVLDDAADWSNVISKLYSSLTTPPPLSAYASAKARASNAAALSSEDLQWSFSQADVLTHGAEQLGKLIGPNPALITLFFALSELYTRSIPKTTKFLMNLTTTAPRGSLILVIDNIGASVTKQTATNAGEHGQEGEKSYPLDWLLYQTLLPRKPSAGQQEDETAQIPQWEKVLQDQNRMFKLPTGLKFPGSLENIKFQVHLLRKL